jgi:hypothetical protein
MQGTQDGEFDEPYALAVNGGVLYVSDTLNDRVQKFGIVVPVLPTTWGKLKTRYTLP